MPPIRIEPVFFGLNGSETSYCKNSPVPKHETYRNLSSSDKLMSVTSGGTALKPFSIAGNLSGSAGSAGISITFLISHAPLLRCQRSEEHTSELQSLTNLVCR